LIIRSAAKFGELILIRQSERKLRKLPIKLVAPITDWKDYFEENLWHVKVEPGDEKGLSKISAIDTLQLRGMDIRRFVEKLGEIDKVTLEEIT
jgi:mRNA interferase MazF